MVVVVVVVDRTAKLKTRVTCVVCGDDDWSGGRELLVEGGPSSARFDQLGLGKEHYYFDCYVQPPPLVLLCCCCGCGCFCRRRRCWCCCCRDSSSYKRIVLKPSLGIHILPPACQHATRSYQRRGVRHDYRNGHTWYTYTVQYHGTWLPRSPTPTHTNTTTHGAALLHGNMIMVRYVGFSFPPALALLIRASAASACSLRRYLRKHGSLQKTMSGSPFATALPVLPPPAPTADDDDDDAGGGSALLPHSRHTSFRGAASNDAGAGSTVAGAALDLDLEGEEEEEEEEDDEDDEEEEGEAAVCSDSITASAGTPAASSSYMLCMEVAMSTELVETSSTSRTGGSRSSVATVSSRSDSSTSRRADSAR
jgi:hypothetical protein